jgi:hypothetical protein
MKRNNHIVRGITKKTGKEIFEFMDQLSGMEPVLVDRSLVRKIEQGAKRANVTAGQYASVLLDAQLNAKTHR